MAVEPVRPVTPSLSPTIGQSLALPKSAAASDPSPKAKTARASPERASGALPQLGDPANPRPVDATRLQDELERARGELNQLLLKVNQRLSFRIHEGSGRMTVHVIDNATNEVVREMPPEAFLDAIAKVREFIGLLFDDRA